MKKAIDKSYELAEDGDLIVFGGSLYLIGDIRKIILKITSICNLPIEYTYL